MTSYVSVSYILFRVTFSNTEGETLECHLKPLSLLFTDLCLPIQLPAGYSEVDDSERQTAAAQLFEELWRKIHDESESNNDGTASQSVESIKCLHAERKEVEDGINQWLEPFIVAVQGIVMSITWLAVLCLSVCVCLFGVFT